MTLYNFMNGLVKKGHEVFVVTVDNSFQWEFDTYKKFPYKKNSPMKKRQIYYGKLARSFLNSALRAIGSDIQFGKNHIAQITESLIRNYEKLGVDSDILVATMTYTGEAVWQLGVGKKIVMHNQHFEELIWSERSAINRLTRLPFHHIVNCQWLDKMFRHYYSIQGEIITPGMDHKIFSASLDSKKYDGREIVKLITYCDPNRKFKGSAEQIKTLAKLYAKNKNVEILIYGLDPKTDRFPYKFLGWISQEQLAKFYTESHILVSFSWYESFPLPPIEAMSAGITVVAGKYGTEDYLIDGKTGIVINPFEIDASARKIENLISHPELMSELASNGKKMAESFTWEKQVDKLNNFLMNLPSQKMIDIDKINSGNLQELDKIFFNLVMYGKN